MENENKKIICECCSNQNSTLVEPRHRIEILAELEIEPDQPWIIGSQETSAGYFNKISSKLTTRDYLGFLFVRLGIKRMNYKVEPGLYAVGEPNAQSEVFVSANFKMSFDLLRKNLADRNCWILVLDTKGINVWCAAGKGIFGTEELIQRIEQTELAKVVIHRTLILPQLGASGVAAPEIKKRTGFKVIYGPVRAKDIPEFMKAGLIATPAMRRVIFPLLDRLSLVPMELIPALKKLFLILTAIFILSGISKIFYPQIDTFSNAVFISLALFGAVFCGSVITPILLPWLPGKAFSFKGAFVGLIWSLIWLSYWYLNWSVIQLNFSRALISLLLLPVVSAFIAMQFTGSSTFTSFSGVKKEMRIAISIMIVALLLSGIIFIGDLVL